MILTKWQAILEGEDIMNLKIKKMTSIVDMKTETVDLDMVITNESEDSFIILVGKDSLNTCTMEEAQRIKLMINSIPPEINKFEMSSDLYTVKMFGPNFKEMFLTLINKLILDLMGDNIKQIREDLISISEIR